MILLENSPIVIAATIKIPSRRCGFGLHLKFLTQSVTVTMLALEVYAQGLA